MFRKIYGMELTDVTGSLSVRACDTADHAGIIVCSPVNSERSPVPALPGAVTNVYLKYVVLN